MEEETRTQKVINGCIKTFPTDRELQNGLDMETYFKSLNEFEAKQIDYKLGNGTMQGLLISGMSQLYTYST